MLHSQAARPAGSIPEAQQPSPRELYFALLQDPANAAMRESALHFLQQAFKDTASQPSPIPQDVKLLQQWMLRSSREAGQRYQQYLLARKVGAPRLYFGSKAHALNFIKNVATTKMVDGAWLYSLVKHWDDPRYDDLVNIYLEELGDGDAGQNHVAIYRQLIREHGCEQWKTLPNRYFEQGLTQLALAIHGDAFLPEVIGFNLAYEQLPLHLLITAYELNELNIDPYYFTLHITIDNALSGHAVQAVHAVQEAMQQFGDREEFMRRLANGARLNMVGMGSVEIIQQFSLEEELLNIFKEKAGLGQFMHTPHCRIGKRHLQEWLSNGEAMPELLQALRNHGWIKRHQDPCRSRFWQLVENDQAVMFGVFSAYEKQVLYDWIAGDALESLPKHERLGPSWRVHKRQASALTTTTQPSKVIHLMPHNKSQNKEQQLLTRQLAALPDHASRMRLLWSWMSPGLHHLPAGLHATRLFKLGLKQ